MSRFLIFSLILRFPPHGSVELLLDHLVVGADGNRREVDLPDRKVGALNCRDSRARLPFCVNGLNQKYAQSDTEDHQESP